MKKAETIKRYGEVAYAKLLEQGRAYYKAHKEQEKVRTKKYYEVHKVEEEYQEKKKVRAKKYREEHPEEEKARSHEKNRKGGKHYAKHLAYDQTGLRGDRNKIRKKHASKYKQYKMIIAPESQLHHEWVPKTAEYRGLALVEAEQHMHGFVDVIEILDGEIKLLSEEEVKRGKKREKEGLQAG